MPVVLPGVAAPIVKPRKVMVKSVLARILPTKVLMTMESVVGAEEVAVMPETDVVPATLASGVADVAKNPLGYIRVIFPPKSNKAVFVKVRVTATPVWAGLR